MISFTQHNLGKLEDLFDTLGFKVRYEKGSFRTGACLIQHTKVIMVNKFSNLEVRILSLISLLQEMLVEDGLLDDKQKEFYKIIKKIER